MRKASRKPAPKTDGRTGSAQSDRARLDAGSKKDGGCNYQYSGASSFATLQRAASQSAHSEILAGLKRVVDTGAKLTTDMRSPIAGLSGSTAPIQRNRTLNAGEKKKIREVLEEADVVYDALVHSRILRREIAEESAQILFDIMERAGDLYDKIDQDDFPDDFSLDDLEESLATLQDAIKEPWGKMKRFFQDRPPADTRGIGDQHPKVKVKTAAQHEISALGAESSLKANLEILRSEDRVFYVYGRSAMGSGDTAFIVRTVALLRGYGLHAVAVKQDAAAHDSAQAFGKAHEKTPQEMYKEARPQDVIVEGPLSDSYRRPEIGATDYESVTEREFNKLHSGATETPLAELQMPFNLRLYEYGTLSLRGGQLSTGPGDNVASNAGKVRHGFLGMGHGEMGAFYNASQEPDAPSFLELVESYAVPKADGKPLPVASKLWELCKENEGAKFLLGYTNKSEEVTNWCQSVATAVAPLGGHYIIIGIFGGKAIPDTFHVKESSFSGMYISERKNLQVNAREPSVSKRSTGNSSVLITNLLPRPLMAALQNIAEPFMATTGNYSLSEAIDGGSFPSYEALHFNAGVSEDLEWQITHAAEYLETPPVVRDAMQGLAGVSPLMLSGKEALIQTLLQNPAEVRKLTAEIRRKTDAGANLVAKLAALISAGDAGRITLDPPRKTPARKPRSGVYLPPQRSQPAPGRRDTYRSKSSKSSTSSWRRDDKKSGSRKPPAKKSDPRNWRSKPSGGDSNRKNW